MPVTIFSLNAAVTQGIITADNGLNTNTPTNVELGGTLTKFTNIVVNAIPAAFQMNSVPSFGATYLFGLNTNQVVMVLTALGGVQVGFEVNTNHATFMAGRNSGAFVSQLDASNINGMVMTDTNKQIGIVNAADYKANIIATPNALTTTAAVQALINAVFNPALYALVAGQAFTGNISAPNLSGTNTGDQNLTPYALLAGAAFTGGITGTTGGFTGAITAPNLPNINATSAKFTGITSTTVLLTFVAAGTNPVYRISIYQSVIAFTSGSSTLGLTYFGFNNVLASILYTGVTAIGVGNTNVHLIGVKSGTTVTVTITIVGTNTTEAAVTAELMY